MQLQTKVQLANLIVTVQASILKNKKMVHWLQMSNVLIEKSSQTQLRTLMHRTERIMNNARDFSAAIVRIQHLKNDVELILLTRLWAIEILDHGAVKILRYKKINKWFGQSNKLLTLTIIYQALAYIVRYWKNRKISDLEGFACQGLRLLIASPLYSFRQNAPA